MRRSWAFLLLIVLGGFALRVWQLDAQSLWFDELIAVHAAAQPLLEIPAADPSNPPLYFILLHFWMALTGDTAFALRMLSVLLGTVLIAGAGALGRRWFGPAVGVLAAALAAISPLLWWYGQEARMYMLLALEVLALLFLLAILRREPANRRIWAVMFSVELAALFTHNLGVAVVGWLNLMMIGIYGRRWRLWVRWLLVQMMLGAALLPWLIWRGRLVRGLANPTYAAPDLNTLVAAWAALWAGSWTLVGAEPGFVRASWILLMLVGLGAVSARRSVRPAGSMLLLTVVLIVGLSAGLLALGHFAYHPRYFVLVAAPVLVLTSAGLVEMARWRLGKLLAAAGVGVALGLSIYALHRIDVTPAYGRDDARGLAAYYRRVLAAGDAVVVPYAYTGEYTLWYYDVPDGVQVVELDGPALRAAQHALNARLPAGVARVELMDWDKSFGDRRGALDCLLAGNGQRLGEPFRVVGLGSQGYRVRLPLELPMVQPVEADFGAFRLTGAAFDGTAPADRARCVVLDWQITAPVTYDAAVALTVTNDFGWEIARAGALLLREDFAPVSLWQAGQAAQSFAVVELPAGIPVGSYSLRARIYRTDTLEALDRFAGGVWSGKDAPLGWLVVEPPEALRAPDPGDAMVPAGIEVDGGRGLVLDAYSLSPFPEVRPGEVVRVTLRWRAAGPGPVPPLGLRGVAYEAERLPFAWPAPGRLVLDWREITISPDAPPGPIDVVLAGEPVARLEVLETGRVFDVPPFDVAVGVVFEDAGELTGFSLAADRVASGQALPLTLVWRATGPTTVPYTVFTHLLDDAGRVIAQSDRMPADGERPTTGWVEGEYIVDVHALVFNEAGKNYIGPATLEVGLYDPLTGQRVSLASGADFVILPAAVEVIE